MSALTPDCHCSGVLELDPAALAGSGVRGVLLDLDNTLLPRGQALVPAAVSAWVRSLEGAGIGACIVSNSGKQRVFETASELGVPVVANARKPFKKGYLRACALLGAAPATCVMVGDQTYTDIWGAHRAGLRAVLVDPLGTEDLWHTRILRRVDAHVVRNMERRQRCGGSGS